MHKSIPLAVCLGTVLAAGAAGAQNYVVVEEPRRPLNTITVDPLPLIFARTLNFEYERAVHRHLSLFGGPSLTFGTASSDSSSNTSYFGLGLTLGARVFPFGRAPRGLFLSPYATLIYASAKATSTYMGSTDEATGSGIGFAVAAILGYTFLIADIFDISIGGGVQYLNYGVTATDSSGRTSTSVGVSGWLPALRFALGFAF